MLRKCFICVNLTWRSTIRPSLCSIYFALRDYLIGQEHRKSFHLGSSVEVWILTAYVKNCSGLYTYPGLPRWGLVVKNPLADAGNIMRCGFDPGVGKMPWMRAWQSTPVFLPGESHGQRSLAG